MIFDFTFGIGTAITIAIIIFGFVGQWFLLKMRSENNSKKIDQTSNDLVDVKNKIVDLRMEMVQNYVPNERLRETENRLYNTLNEISVEIREIRNHLMDKK